MSQGRHLSKLKGSAKKLTDAAAAAVAAGAGPSPSEVLPPAAAAAPPAADGPALGSRSTCRSGCRCCGWLRTTKQQLHDLHPSSDQQMPLCLLLAEMEAGDLALLSEVFYAL